MSRLPRRLIRLALLAIVLTAGAIGVVLLPGCAARELSYDPMESRPVCHLRYDHSEWHEQQLNIAIWNAYQNHIGMHPNDYWGLCEPTAPDNQPDSDPGKTDDPKMQSRRGGPKKK